jgi:thymidine kinase
MNPYLELILGPMFSGKTTYLIELYHKYISEGKTVAVLNYSEDTRYHERMLSSHDKVMIPCIFCKNISETFKHDEVIQSDIILINEGQFFPDLVDTVIELVEQHRKRVYICGLDGDFKRRKFGALLDLIPLCDEVKKLKGTCTICRKDSIFSHRVSEEEEVVVIGVTNYISACRDCYLNKTTLKPTKSQETLSEIQWSAHSL